MTFAPTTSNVVRRAIAAGALMGILSSVAPAQTYTVRLTRPWKAGDRYRISATGSVSQFVGGGIGEMMSNDRLDERSVELLADATVLETRPDGRIAKESLEIDHCVVRNRNTKKDLFPTGTVIVAFVENGDQGFSLKGQAVDKEAKNALLMVVSLEPEEITEDQVFRTAQERKVGERWAIDPAAAARWLGQPNADSKKNSVRGVATIKKKVNIGGIECLVIDYSIGVSQSSGARLQVAMSGIFPIDITQHPLEHSRHFTTHAAAGVPPDARMPAIQIDITLERKMTARYTML